MLVIASGSGNIDLSVASVLTLAAYVSMAVDERARQRTGARAWRRAACRRGRGRAQLSRDRWACGCRRSSRRLAWSFVFQSAAYNLGGEATLKPPPALLGFRLDRRPARRAGHAGRCHAPDDRRRLHARPHRVGAPPFGDRPERARGAACRHQVGRVRLVAYIFSGVLGRTDRLPLSGFSGGAALNMGDAYLMEFDCGRRARRRERRRGTRQRHRHLGRRAVLQPDGHDAQHLPDPGRARFMLMGALIILIVAIAPRPGRLSR